MTWACDHETDMLLIKKIYFWPDIQGQVLEHGVPGTWKPRTSESIELDNSVNVGNFVTYLRVNKNETNRFLSHLWRLSWVRRTFWRWWDDWDDTALQTQDSKLKPWRSEAEHATSRSRRFPTILNHYEWAGKNFFLKFEGQSGVRTRDLRLTKQAALITAPGPDTKLCSSLQDIHTW